MIPHALRIPSTTPDRWVYLRGWDELRECACRSHGALLNACYAGPDGWRVSASVAGLAPVKVEREAPWQDNAAALDAYLVGIGAEIVSEDEWPRGCDGPGYRADRVPL